MRSQWGRNLAWARVALGVASLALELVPSPRSHIAPALVVGSFLLYSLALAAKGHAHSGVFGLLALFTDTVFFLILTNYGADRTLWLPCLFYIYLLLTAVALYSPQEVLVVVGVCILFFVFASQAHWQALRKTIVAVGAFACIFSVFKKRLETRIADLTQDAQAAREAAAKARELEGQRIAADLHDGPLQSLISFQMRLEILRKVLERDRGAGLEELEQLRSLSKSQVAELRSFVRSMRPLDLDGANLAASARRVAEEFQKESGIPVTFIGGETPFAAPEETYADVLRMLREALYNVQKHARATRVAVAMEKVGNTLEISIDDNGVGFDFSGAFTLDELDLLRTGPVSIKRRARSLNADLVLESRPGRGAGLKMKIPI